MRKESLHITDDKEYITDTFAFIKTSIFLKNYEIEQVRDKYKARKMPRSYLDDVLKKEKSDVDVWDELDCIIDVEFIKAKILTYKFNYKYLEPFIEDMLKWELKVKIWWEILFLINKDNEIIFWLRALDDN